MIGPAVSRARAARTVVAALAAAGVAVGAVWAWLAPPVHGVVALTRSGGRVKVALGNEADNWFFGAVVMVGLLSVLAVVAALLVWQWRAHRGPLLAGALAAGLLAASAAGTGVGAAVARWRYGAVDVAAAPVTDAHRVHYVVEGPSVFFAHTPAQIALTLLFPMAVGAGVYLLGALSTPRDDLGAWPPIDYPALSSGRSATAAGAPPAGPAAP